MDLGDIPRATRRHWWLVAVVLVAALGCAGLVTALTVPQYASSVTFFVTTPSDGVSDSYQGGLFSQQRVSSYEHLLTGELTREVAAADGIDLTPEQVRARITSRAVPDTVLLQATVTDRDAARSERIASVLAAKFASLVGELETPLDGATPAVKVEVVDGPTLNPVPVSPKPVRNFALAAVLGLLLGLATAVGREMLDVTVKTGEALQNVTGAPVLALVPFDARAKQAPVLAGNGDADGGAKRSRLYSARAEAFRHLRTNLQFVEVDRPAKVIAVTSSVLDEGKSTTATNLAITFAEAGHRVALVEADMRRPRVANYLGLEGAVGLSNVLAGQVDVSDALQRWGRHEVHVLPSGFASPNPSELLGSHNMAVLLARLRKEFGVVIVDTPPVVPFTDAAVVGAMADGVLLVVRSAKTHQARIRAAVASLRAVDSRLLGTVLNMHNVKSEEGCYYYGHPSRDDERQSRSLPAGPPAAPATPTGSDTVPAPDRTVGAGR